MVATEFFKNLAVSDSLLYIGVFGLSSYVLIILGMIAGGTIEGLDEVDADMDSSFLNLSLGSFFSFLAGWGFLGNALIDQFELSNSKGAVLGIIGGVCLTFLHSFLRVMIKKAEHKVEMPTVPAGEIGTCYLTIRPGSKGKVTLRGREVVAVSEEEIKSHESVRVVKESRLDQIVTVEKV